MRAGGKPVTAEGKQLSKLFDKSEHKLDLKKEPKLRASKLRALDSLFDINPHGLEPKSRNDTTSEFYIAMKKTFEKEMETKKGYCQTWKTCLMVHILPVYIKTPAAAHHFFPLFKTLWEKISVRSPQNRLTLLSDMSIQFKNRLTDGNDQEQNVLRILKLYFTLTSGEFSQQKSNEQQKQDKRAQNQQKLNIGDIYEFQRKALLLLESNTPLELKDYGTLSVALLVAGGSRFIELMSHRVADFDVSSTREGYIQQTGRAKEKKRVELLDSRLFVIDKPLVGMNANEFLSALNVLRNSKFVTDIIGPDPNNFEQRPKKDLVTHLQGKQLAIKTRLSNSFDNPNNPNKPGWVQDSDVKTRDKFWYDYRLTNEQITNSALYRYATDATKTLYKDYYAYMQGSGDALVGVHLNRSAYITIGYHINDVGPVTKAYWTRVLLGHDSDDSAKNYQKFFVDTKIIAVDEKLQETVRLYQAKIDQKVIAVQDNHTQLAGRVSAIDKRFDNIQQNGITIKGFPILNAKKKKPISAANAAGLDEFGARSHSTTVVLRNNDNQAVMLTKVPNDRYRRETKRGYNTVEIIKAHIKRVDDALTRLKNANVSTHRSNVRAMGLSSDTIKMWLNQEFLHKGDLNSFNTAMRDTSNGVQSSRNRRIAKKQVVKINNKPVVAEIKTKHDNRYRIAVIREKHIKAELRKLTSQDDEKHGDDDYRQKLKENKINPAVIRQKITQRKANRDKKIRQYKQRLAMQVGRVSAIKDAQKRDRIRNTKHILSKNHIKLNDTQVKTKMNLTQSEFDILKFAI